MSSACSAMLIPVSVRRHHVERLLLVCRGPLGELLGVPREVVAARCRVAYSSMGAVGAKMCGTTGTDRALPYPSASLRATASYSICLPEYTMQPNEQVAQRAKQKTHPTYGQKHAAASDPRNSLSFY